MTISPKFKSAAIRLARSYYFSQFGPMGSSVWADLEDAVLFETADPKVGFWRNPEFDSWAQAWADVDEGEEPRDECGQYTHAWRLTETLGYVRKHLQA